MSDTKHTLGPWKWDGNVCNYDPNQEAPWLTAGDIVVLGGEITCKVEADAALIAAAPDLLAACLTIEPEYLEILADFLDIEHPDLRKPPNMQSHLRTWAKLNRAAIAKAKPQ